MTDKAKQELDRLFPGEVYKTQSGEEVVVRPITFGQLKIFIDAISSLASKAAQAGIDDIEDMSQWPALFNVAYDEISKLMLAILNDEKYDEDWIYNQAASDMIGVFAIILKQNANEVTKKNIQALVDAIKSVTPTSSSSSSSTDTPGTESKT
jgi:hypothetical protein